MHSRPHQPPDTAELASRKHEHIVHLDDMAVGHRRAGGKHGHIVH